jgi:hypothetical protein
LNEGISLADNANTPQYKQALKLMQTWNFRNSLIDKLRIISMIEIVLQIENRSQYSDAEITQLVRTKFDSMPEDHNLYARTKLYLEYRPKQKEIQAELDRLLDEMNQINQPVAHQYQLVKQIDL